MTPPRSDAGRADDPFLALVRRVEAIAAQGLAFADDRFDRVRYADLAEVAAGLLAELAGRPVRSSLPELETEGYLTPKVDVRAGVFDEQERVLLVLERASGRWTLPGGYAEVGRTPREAVLDEVRQESGWTVEVERLVGLLDRCRWPHPPHRYHLYRALFLCRPVAAGAPDGLETDDVGWFDVGALPPLDPGRTAPEQVHLLLAHHRDPSRPPYVD